MRPVLHLFNLLITTEIKAMEYIISLYFIKHLHINGRMDSLLELFLIH